jgi:DNA repair exonuclease SbcCD ATPase subunit
MIPMSELDKVNAAIDRYYDALDTWEKECRQRKAKIVTELRELKKEAKKLAAAVDRASKHVFDAMQFDPNDVPDQLLVDPNTVITDKLQNILDELLEELPEGGTAEQRAELDEWIHEYEAEEADA